MNVKGKYLKDEDGNIISPVVSTDSIYHKGMNASSIIEALIGDPTFELLYEGDATVPSKSSNNKITITLQNDIQLYDMLMFVNIARVSFIHKLPNENYVLQNDECSVGFMDISNWGGEFVNFFGFYTQKISNTQIQLYSSRLATITTTGTISAYDDYATNINAIYGFNTNPGG